MRDNGVDIIVTSPTGHTRVAVEVKLAGDLEAATSQLREYMKGVGASVGLIVGREEIGILRDTYAGEPSIGIAGRYPTSLVHDLEIGEDELEFEEHVQRWLESLLTNDDVADEPLLSALRMHLLPAMADGTVRAAGPRARRHVR